MMTLEELRETKINERIAREAFEHASRRLDDVLETSKNYEQKAVALFGGYVTVALALFGLGASIASGQDPLPLASWVLGGVGAPLYVTGAFFFVFALIDADYGTRGSSPDMWLSKDVIGGSDDVLPLMLAYITHHHKRRIDVSIAGNKRKAILLRLGILTGAVGPLLLMALFVFVSLVKGPF